MPNSENQLIRKPPESLPSAGSKQEVRNYSLEDLERDFGEGVYDFYTVKIPVENLKKIGAVPLNYRDAFAICHQAGGVINAVSDLEKDRLEAVLKEMGEEGSIGSSLLAFKVSWRPRGTERTRDFMLSKETPLTGILLKEK